MVLILALLAGITGWRICRLIIEDDIAAKPVNFLLKISNYNKYLNKLLTCYYCLGFWVGLGLYVLYLLFPGTALHIFTAGAIIGAIPLIQEFKPENE